MISKQRIHTIIRTASWIGAIVSVAYIGAAIHGGRTALAEETNTLVCTPASTTNSYTMPSPTSWRLTETSQVGDTSWSGHYVGQTIVTDGTDQYIVYYNADRRITVGYRTIGDPEWELYTIPGNEAVVGWDSHNYLTAAVDKNGNLHVSGNMHGGAIKYWQTTSPRQLSSLEKVTTLVNAADETSVTYPTFLKDKNDDLLFYYRNGESGSGRVYFNKYNATLKTWSALLSTDLFDGLSGTPDRSAYFNLTPTPNSDGYYEMTWMWRDTGDVATNSRLSYARSTDLQNWETISGAAITLPITYNTPGVVFDDVPQNGGLFNNQERIGVDANGATTITYSKYDENGSNQIYIARADAAGAWQTTQITQWTGAWTFWGGGTLAARIGLGGTSVLPNGDLRFNFSCGGATASSGAIILNNNSLAPIAQIPTYNPDIFPNEIYATTQTTPASISRRVTSLPDPTHRYILKWQSQGVNQDQPFALYPPAQPVVVYSLTPYSIATAPTGLTATRSPDGASVSLSWVAPADNGGYTISDYSIEYTGDYGSSWTTFNRPASTDTSAVIPGLSPSLTYYYRISAVTSFGVGAPVTNVMPSPVPPNNGAQNPAAPILEAGELPGVPNTGSFLPTTVHPAVTLLLGVSSSVLLLYAGRRAEADE